MKLLRLVVFWKFLILFVLLILTLNGQKKLEIFGNIKISTLIESLNLTFFAGIVAPSVCLCPDDVPASSSLAISACFIMRELTSLTYSPAF